MNRILVWSVLSLAGCGASVTAKDAGFGGTWILDVNGPYPANAPVNLKMKIKIKGTRVTIESTFSEPADGIVPLLYLGIMAERFILAVNGQQQENRIGPFHIRSKTTVEGNQMLTDWVATVSRGQVQGHWCHTLKDADHLALEIREEPVGGHRAEATLYLVRK